MKSTSYWALGLLLTFATIISGVVYGRQTSRWGTPPDMAAAAARLEKLPSSVGDWQAVRDNPLDPAVERMLQCSGTISRAYQNSRTGDIVSIAVLLGPAGPIAVHTPEICYSSRDYRMDGKRELCKLSAQDGVNDELWDLRMQANDVSQSSLRVLYGWTNDATWHATDNPRFTYGGSPYLYKLQLAGPEPQQGQSHDVCQEFLQAFLPQLRKHLMEP